MENQEVEVHTKCFNNTEEFVDDMNPDSDSGSFDVLDDIEEKGGETNEVTVTMSDTPVLGMTFDNDENAYKYYNSYARRVGFSVRKLRLNKNRHGAIWKRQFCCSCEGFYTKKRTPKKKREEKRFGCEAMFEIKLSKAGKYVVTKFIVEHTHDLIPASSSQCLRSQRKIERSQVGGIHQLKRSSNDATYEVEFDLCGEEALASIRFRKLWHAFQPILAFGVTSDEAFNFVMSELLKLEEKLDSLYQFRTRTCCIELLFKF